MSTSYSERKPKDFKPSDGDWVCDDAGCGNVNFARRSNCNRCGNEKKEKKTKKMGQEIGAGAAEKSKGLFSAEDWQCSKCGNVNWARRSTCNVCNGPKFGEVEERTGLGGGFNERGIVEYKENIVEDDEYDVYGRKKKKKSGEKVNEVKKSVVSYEDDDEDEEDDDDDEGDLSKYDLWGDDDDKKDAKADADSPEKNGNTKRKKSRSSSRSRSRSHSRDRKKTKSKRSRSRSSSGSSRSRSGSRSRRKSRRSHSSSSSSSGSSRGSSRSNSRSRYLGS